MAETKNIFIIGYEDFAVELLQALPGSERINFLPALSREEMVSADEIPAMEIYEKALAAITNSRHNPDAIITFWDFPATIITAMLNRRFGLIGPPVRSIFKAEHKSWSRAEQRKVIIDHIPRFASFDPKDKDAYSKLQLLTPFWIKPVKSFRSYLSYQVNDQTEFEEYREIMAQQVDGIYRPFIELMRLARMPELICSGEESCIAESPLSGRLCTLEGYVFDNEVVSYGIVDSIREKESNSFQRYQYPSQLPMEIQYRMMDIARRVIGHLGMNDTCFNIEFFYNQTADRINLLEINPRTSESHTDLFAKVHGYSQLKILLELALGNRPKPLERNGDYRMAAKVFYRAYQPGVVEQVPAAEQIAEIIARFPDTKIKLNVDKGDDLRDLKFQDSYSFELATIFLGADNEIELMRKYEEIVELLDIRIAFVQE